MKSKTSRVERILRSRHRETLVSLKRYDDFYVLVLFETNPYMFKALLIKDISNISIMQDFEILQKYNSTEEYSLLEPLREMHKIAKNRKKENNYRRDKFKKLAKYFKQAEDN